MREDANGIEIESYDGELLIYFGIFILLATLFTTWYTPYGGSISLMTIVMMFGAGAVVVGLLQLYNSVR